MKLILLIVTSFISMHSFTQEAQANTSDDKYVLVTDFNIHGYINGIRLDSVQATYAEFGFAGSNRISFDYGQIVNKNRDYFITNKEGKWLYLDKSSYAFLLNFFHYNHWELTQAFATTSYEWILKKQDAAQP